MAPEQGSHQGPARGSVNRPQGRSDYADEADWQREHEDLSTHYEDASPEEIEADIRRTRAEMDETLNELQQRLNPKNLWGEVMGMFRSKSKTKGGSSDGKGEMAKKVGKGVVKVIREYPVPTVLVTTALTTLIYQTASRSKSRSHEKSNIRSINIYRGEPTMYGGSHVHAQSGEPYGYTGEHTGQQQFQFGRGERGERGESSRSSGDQPGVMQRARESASEFRSQASEKAGELRSQASERMSQMGEKMSHAGESARSSLHQARESVRGGVQHAGESLRSGMQRTSEALHSGTSRMREGASHMGQQMRHGVESAREFAEERPLTVGIGALALGLVAGLLIPRTQKEDRLMGQQSEQFMHAAREKGQELYERGKHVAEEAMDAAAEAASEESQKQGLTPE